MTKITPRCWLRALLVVALGVATAPAWAARDVNYEQGYADALLQRVLRWQPGSYRAALRGRALYVTPPANWKGGDARIRRLLRAVPGVQAVRVVQSTKVARSGSIDVLGLHLGGGASSRAGTCFVR